MSQATDVSGLFDCAFKLKSTHEEVSAIARLARLKPSPKCQKLSLKQSRCGLAKPQFFHLQKGIVDATSLQDSQVARKSHIVA